MCVIFRLMPTYVDRLERNWSFLKTMSYGFFGVIGLFSAAVLAQTVSVPAPSPSILDVIKANFLTPTTLVSLVISTLGILGSFAWASEKRKRILAEGVHLTYAVVETVGREIDGDDNFDKAARGILELDKWLVANGWRPSTPEEQAVAKMGFTAIHGNEIAKAKVVAAAAIAVDVAKAEEVTRPI